MLTVAMSVLMIGTSDMSAQKRKGTPVRTTQTTKKPAAKKLMSFRHDDGWTATLMSNGTVTIKGKKAGKWKNVDGAMLVELYAQVDPRFDGAEFAGFIIDGKCYEAFYGSESYDIVKYDPAKRTITCGFADDPNTSSLSDCRSYKVTKF